MARLRFRWIIADRRPSVISVREKSAPILPRTYHVWPHALPKPQTDAEKAAVAAEVANFQPDAYQAKMAKWMFRNMAANLTHTLDEPTATYLETVASEEVRTMRKRLSDYR
jgi:hypothetical protein